MKQLKKMLNNLYGCQCCPKVRNSKLISKDELYSQNETRTEAPLRMPPLKPKGGRNHVVMRQQANLRGCLPTMSPKLTHKGQGDRQ